MANVKCKTVMVYPKGGDKNDLRIINEEDFNDEEWTLSRKKIKPVAEEGGENNPEGEEVPPAT